MRKLMLIDACMRDEVSRTRRILGPLVAELEKRYEIETVRLDGEDYSSVGRRVLAERSGGYVPEETVALARRLAAADRIVIAAPFWDMSFPAILKVSSRTAVRISRACAVARRCSTSPPAAWMCIRATLSRRLRLI